MKVCLNLHQLRRADVSLVLLAALLAGCNRASAPTPISVGGTPAASPSAGAGPIVFHNRTLDAGLNYQWKAVGSRPLNILGTIGNGCAFLDYDGDGNQDILLIGSPCALYKGDGKGKFADVSAQTGIASLSGRYLGVAVGDINGDARPDLYVTAYRGGALLQNEGGTFRDVTKAAGLPSQPWTTSATFLDANGDGSLDLYVGNYVQFGPNTDPQLCESGGLKTACGPRYYDPASGALYLGNGKGGFRDTTKAAGIAYLKKSAEAIATAAKLSGKSLGVASADFDNSGSIGLALANDEMPGDLLQNKGRGRFENIGQLSGTAYDRNGGMHGGMGIDWGDVNNDGKLDLFVGTFQNEAKCLYLNQGDGLFDEQSDRYSLAPARPYVTFGSKFLDFDNDGYLDLLIANGHVQDNIDQVDKSATYRQPTLLLRNEGGERYEDASARLSEDARRPVVGRGLAVGDYDNDGKVDGLVVDSEGAPLLLHNEGKAGNWIGFRLSQPDGNRLSYGAVVTVKAGDKTYVRHCRADGSYMSSSDPRVHVGLGDAKAVASVTVRWPGGKTESFGAPAPGQYHLLERGKGR